MFISLHSNLYQLEQKFSGSKRVCFAKDDLKVCNSFYLPFRAFVIILSCRDKIVNALVSMQCSSYNTLLSGSVIVLHPSIKLLLNTKNILSKLIIIFLSSSWHRLGNGHGKRQVGFDIRIHLYRN